MCRTFHRKSGLGCAYHRGFSQTLAASEVTPSFCRILYLLPSRVIEILRVFGIAESRVSRHFDLLLGSGHPENQTFYFQFPIFFLAAISRKIVVSFVKSPTS